MTIIVLGSVLENGTAVAGDCSTPSFATPTNYPAGQYPWSVAVGDFNGDGTLDLAVVNFSSHNFSVMMGKGDGTFQLTTNYSLGTRPESVAAGDFNGDGKLDLAAANSGDNTISIFLGNGDGTFQFVTNCGAGTEPYSVVAGDFNQDGRLDLAVANLRSDNISVLVGYGDGTFQPPTNYPVANIYSYLTVGDFNGDGKPDLAVASWGGTNGTVWVLTNNGDGTFQAPVAVTALAAAQPLYIATGDFNGDGKLDIAFPTFNGSVAILPGNGDGTFQAAVGNYAVGTYPGGMAVGDFNGDGRTDLAVDYESGQYPVGVVVLLANGDGTFQTGNFNLGGIVGVGGMAVGDFRSNGKPDLAVASQEGVSVLLNTCPCAGVHLVVTQTNGGPILSWPLPYTNWVLESATNLDSTNWQGVVEPMSTSNGCCEVVMPRNQAPGFFRLHKP